MNRVSDRGFILAQFRDLCLVLRSDGGLVNSNLPLCKTLVCILDLSYFFFIFRIDRLFGFNAISC